MCAGLKGFEQSHHHHRQENEHLLLLPAKLTQKPSATGTLNTCPGHGFAHLLQLHLPQCAQMAPQQPSHPPADPASRGHFQPWSLLQWRLHTRSLGKLGVFLRVLLGLGLGRQEHCGDDPAELEKGQCLLASRKHLLCSGGAGAPGQAVEILPSRSLQACPPRSPGEQHMGSPGVEGEQDTLPNGALRPLCPGQATPPRSRGTQGPAGCQQRLTQSLLVVTRAPSEQMWEAQKHPRPHSTRGALPSQQLPSAGEQPQATAWLMPGTGMGIQALTSAKG